MVATEADKESAEGFKAEANKALKGDESCSGRALPSHCKVGISFAVTCITKHALSCVLDHQNDAVKIQSSHDSI